MKIPAIGCVDRDYIFCCYTSPFARIFMEQVHKSRQLGRTYPMSSCSGLSLDEISQVDWGKIDLTEWTALILSVGDLDLSEEQQKLLNSYQNVTNSETSLTEEETQINELVHYFAERSTDPKLQAQWEALSDNTKWQIEEREKEIALEYAQNSANTVLGDEVLDLIHNNVANESNQTADNDLNNKITSVANGNSKQQQLYGKQLGAIQTGVNLIELCDLNSEELAQAIIDYRIDVESNVYSAVANAINNNNFNGEISVLLNNIRNEKCLGGSYKIAAKAMNVENLTGQDSALDIKKSSTQIEECTDDNPSCNRKSSAQRMENTVNTLIDNTPYENLEELRKKADNSTVYNVD